MDKTGEKYLFWGRSNKQYTKIKEKLSHVVQIHVCRSLLSIAFTANGKPEFVPRDHVFHFNHRLLFIITTCKSLGSRQF